MCTWNGRTEAGLVNGLVGHVREIIYGKNQAPPSLPVAILVDFKVYVFYRDISWLGDADGVDTDDVRVVKFAPKRDDFKTAYPGVRAEKQKSCHRTQFPLRLLGHVQSTKARAYRWSTSLEILETPSSPLD